MKRIRDKMNRLTRDLASAVADPRTQHLPIIGGYSCGDPACPTADEAFRMHTERFGDQP